MTHDARLRATLQGVQYWRHRISGEVVADDAMDGNTRFVNAGLEALHRVTGAIAEGAADVPYDSNPLTLLLRNFVGGNARTVMVVHVWGGGVAWPLSPAAAPQPLSPQSIVVATNPTTQYAPGCLCRFSSGAVCLVFPPRSQDSGLLALLARAFPARPHRC